MDIFITHPCSNELINVGSQPAEKTANTECSISKEKDGLSSKNIAKLAI